MTTSQRTSRKISLEMKSQGHYKKAAKSYRKSDQYINMINLYPILQSTLIDCEDAVSYTHLTLPTILLV